MTTGDGGALVGLAVDGNVATVTLDNPAALNAISLALVGDFNAALDRLEAIRPRVRCLVLTGAGKAFCAGGDISAHLGRPPDAEPYDLGDVLRRSFNPLLLRLLHLPMPFVVAVNGRAAGAGVPLALCGDMVVAGQSAFFECGFARIGLMPDLGATWLLPRLIGRARAHAMMLLDQRVAADTAAAWGMIHACVPDDELLPTAGGIARRLAGGSTEALVATRLATLAAGSISLADALDHEAASQRRLGAGTNFAEGIAAFFARRPPRFQ